MADITLLQQDVILLKLRIAKLEDDKKHLQSDMAVLLAERDQGDRAVKELYEKLKNTEKVNQAQEWSRLMMQSKYHKALEKIERLKSELIEALGSDADESSEDTPSATSVQEYSE